MKRQQTWSLLSAVFVLSGCLLVEAASFTGASSTLTRQLCQSLSSPELAQPFDTKEEALSALKNTIEKKVEQRKLAGKEDVEYGAVIVKCDGKYRVETIAEGKEGEVFRTEDNYILATGQPLAEVVCGMHYHPNGGSLTGSIGDLIASNQGGYDEYIVVKNPNGKGLSPDIGKLSPDGTTAVVRLVGTENGMVESESPKQGEVLAELAMDPRCQDVDIARKIADNVKPDGKLNPGIIDDPACMPKEAIPVEQFAGIHTEGVADQVPVSQTVNSAPATQTSTIDNTAMKAQASAMLESAYQYASGIAAEADVGAEYQSAVAPVMSQGRAAISSIPDQQTVSVPVGSAQGGGYSSEIMDQVGKTFAEQGTCAAGLQLEALKNQNRNR